jgi:hypothetical protein
LRRLDDVEGETPVLLRQGNRDADAATAVLRGVLDRLQAAVVDRGLDLRRVAADSDGVDLRRRRGVLANRTVCGG